MSFRNGDKSREHRLRKAREKKRDAVRELKNVKGDAKAPSAQAKALAKAKARAEAKAVKQ